MRSLENLIAEAKAAFEAMNPVEQLRLRDEQRRSWVRGELMMENPAMTAEQADALIEMSQASFGTGTDTIRSLAEEALGWRSSMTAAAVEAGIAVIREKDARIAGLETQAQGLARDADFNGRAADQWRVECEKQKELADKFMWQVRDTCVRAERAEARIAELEAEVKQMARERDKAKAGRGYEGLARGR